MITNKVVTFVFVGRLVDLICEKMSESLDADPSLGNANKGTNLAEHDGQDHAGNCGC